MDNNPILHSDALGDTARGVNQQSAERELQIIKGSFTGEGTEHVQKLFKFKGNTFKQIKQKALDKAMSTLTTDQKALAKGYTEVISSTTVHNIEVIKSGETLSEMGKEITGLKTGQDIVNIEGGGTTSRTGPNNENFYEAIVMDVTKNVSINGVPDKLPPSAGEISAHEILGHALGKEHGYLNNNLDAVRAGNLYLRAQGDYRYRDAHVVTFDLSMHELTQIPQYIYQINNER